MTERSAVRGSAGSLSPGAREGRAGNGSCLGCCCDGNQGVVGNLKGCVGCVCRGVRNVELSVKS